jgi:hypothetical protein
MIESYVQAFFDRPPVVLKRQLRAYSLGHDFILDAAGNPYASGVGPFGVDDFLLAVHVCTLTFAEAVEFYRNPTTLDAAKWAEECGAVDWAEEARAFMEYLKAGRSVPPRKVSQDAKPHKAPWQLCVAAAVCGQEAMTPERMGRIMDMPVREAILWNAVRRETLGDDSLLSEEEHAIIQMGKAIANGTS